MPQSQPSPPRLAYSVPEAARVIACGKTKVWELVHSGKLKARRNGGRILILAEDLQAFLATLEAVR